MKARALRKGETIAVVGVSGPVRPERLRKGIDALLDADHPVEVGRGALQRHGFFAGPDEVRAADLDAAIHREDLPAIFFSRGGWGAMRVLERVDLEALRARPRVLLGYSDLTTIFMALQRPGRPYPVRYGPNVVELGEPRAFDAPSLEKALYLPEPRLLHTLTGCRIVRPGRGRGVLIGGCLSLIVSLLGTPWDLPFDGSILFWEEFNEPPHRIDRMLTQLRLAKKLEGLAGMIVGRLARCGPGRGSPALPLREMLLDAAAGTRYPIVTDFPCGHIPRKRTLLLGVPAEISTARRRLVLQAR